MKTAALAALVAVLVPILAEAAPITFQRTYGGAGQDLASSVQQTTDGGYIVAGSADYDVYLVRTNASGDTLWTRTYGTGWGNSVQQTADGGFIIAGFDPEKRALHDYICSTRVIRTVG